MTVQKKRTKVQEAIVALRAALGHISQQELAVRMGKAVTTIGRWEAMKPPIGASLVELQQVALEAGLHDLAMVFKTALSEEQGTIGIAMTVGERVQHDALMDVLRNRHIPEVNRGASKILDQLIETHSTLVRKGQAGTNLFGGELDEIENTNAELKGSKLPPTPSVTVKRKGR